MADGIALNQPRAISTQAIRIAAIGDLHLRAEVPEGMASDLLSLEGEVDLLVIAGDITESGRIPEVGLATELFSTLTMPKIAVLGNHDRRGMRRRAMRLLLESSGVRLLDGDSMTLRFADGRRIAIAGVGGYGGGFWPEEAPDLPGARISKAVGVRARREALRLSTALDDIGPSDVDAVVVVMHYSPTVSTLGEEPLMKYWMLGNSLLGRVIDDHRVDLVIHGHAHLGNHEGQTPGGTPVRNVAAHVTGGPKIYDVAGQKTVESVQFSPGLARTGVLPGRRGATS
ncbi:MAG: metallophosphoesterase [Chloroflexota bacterium]|nr:metallophosphoesterase [Chloroflexota bacterium]